MKKVKHEFDIPNGRIIVREEPQGEEESGPFGMFSDDKTCRLLKLAGDLSEEATGQIRASGRRSGDRRNGKNTFSRR